MRNRTTPVRAPELLGAGGWVGAGPGLTLRSLRGRVVLLHFLTAGCVNCVHVVDELRPLAARWADELTVLGVHSPKFAHEAEHAAVERAVRRLGITHPVLDDADRRTWDAYAAKAWPTLVVVDQRGYLAHVTTGEGRAAELDAVVAELVADGVTTPGLPGAPEVRDPAVPDPVLRDPRGLAATPDGTLLVADTGHAQVVELAADAVTELRRHDGAFTDVTALAPLPADLAAELGYDVVVADRAGHRLHGLDRATGTVVLLAGTGRPWRPGDPADGPATTVPLASPSAVVHLPGTGGDTRPGPALVAVALAGNHTLAELDLRTGLLRRTAGRVTEGLGDGPVAEAFLAQPTALAVDDDRLWFVDAESSALRWLAGGVVRTAVGAGLFDFGHVDGPALQARLQHPEGVAVGADGSILVADTYDGAVRRFDPATGAVSTLAAGLVEPRAVLVHGGRVLVLAGDELLALPVPAPAAVPEPAAAPAVAPGRVALDVRAGGAGVRLDDRDGPATRVEATADPASLLVSAGTDEVVLAGEGTLTLRVRAALCDDGEHPVCRVVERTWVAPVRAGGGDALVLDVTAPG